MDVNLVLIRKDGSTKNFSLPSNVTIIGRREDCDLCIPLMVVSRKHCQFSVEDDKLSLRDLGSRNGTFINGTQIEESHINAGDRVQIGPVSFAIQIDGQPVGDSAILKTPKHLSEPEDIVLNQEYSIAIFRIFQETLTNIARHAEAAKVEATLRRHPGKIEMRVQDDGKGIEKKQISDPKSYGLIGMHERVHSLGGELRIEGIKDRGTTIVVVMPLNM